MPRELMLETATGAFALCPYELPPLQPEDVRIRLELAAVKHGTESHAWSGAVNRGRPWDPRLRLFLDPPRDNRDAQGAAVAALPGRNSNEAGASATGALPPLVAVGNMAVGVDELKKDESVIGTELSRGGFLKATGVVAGAALASTLSGTLLRAAPEEEVEQIHPPTDDRGHVQRLAGVAAALGGHQQRLNRRGGGLG